MSEGIVTLSFDCEGKWGMTDTYTPWDVKLTRDNLLKVYEFILDTLAAYNIPATFAFVGALTETREEFLDTTYPKLSSDSYLRWLNFSNERILNKCEEGWFLPELLQMVRAKQVHEIATHGFTHVPFSTLNELDANLELGFIRDWAQRNKLECSTIIYPRNMIGYEESLKDYGIFGYRDSPATLLGKKIPKQIRSFAEEILILKKSEAIYHSNPVKVPGGAFINWRIGYRQFIPIQVSMLKYRSMIHNAVKRGEVAHLWLHPHNLITSPSTKNLFEQLCAEIASCRDRMSLVVKRQKDYLKSEPKS